MNGSSEHLSMKKLSQLDSIAASTVVIVDPSSFTNTEAKLVIPAPATREPNIFWYYINKKNSSCVINSIFAHGASFFQYAAAADTPVRERRKNILFLTC